MSKALNQIECPQCHHVFSLDEQFSKIIKRDIEKEYEEKLAVSQTLLKAQLETDFEQKHTLQTQDLKTQIAEKTKQLEETTKNELALLKKTRELEQKEKNLELEVARTLANERANVEQELKKTLTSEYQLQLTEKDIKLESLGKTIEELKRKSQQGSQQAQGEAMEVEIENTLIAKFPTDKIIPIAKGQRGADVLQEVLSPRGEAVGSILYESKNTKTWTDAYLQKAKDDQREKKADVVVIITQVMPKGITGYKLTEGVWVSDYKSYPLLAEALKVHLIELYMARNATIGKTEKLDLLYRYISESAFKQRIEAIVEAFKQLRESTESEKRAMQKIWAVREKCLERVLIHTAGMYGDIQGIIGTSLPKIETLELPEGPTLTDNQDEDAK